MSDEKKETNTPRKPLVPSPVLDVAGILVAVAVLALGAAVWLMPPLFRASRPTLTYAVGDQTYTNAALFRPLAMPSRYYIELPRLIAGRYRWFVVDRRREIAAILTNAPSSTLFGLPAIRRNDPLGIDLEFRKMDNSEWRVSFSPTDILFTNAILKVRLEAK